MAVRPIVKLGDEILRKKSREVESFDVRLCMLLDDMAETMKKENGCGIAAVQVGILRRAFLVDTGEGVIEYINPKILSSEGREVETEGCLSVPDRSGKVARPEKITIKAQNRRGDYFEKTLVGYAARAFCHENDHLNGVLYIDRLEQ